MLIIFELLIASIYSQTFVHKDFNGKLDSGQGSDTGYREKFYIFGSFKVIEIVMKKSKIYRMVFIGQNRKNW